MNFRIGEDVVSLSTDSKYNNGIKKGCIYQVKALSASVCKCDILIVDVGIPLIIDPRFDQSSYLCSQCKTSINNDGKRWYSSIHFAPLQTESEEADMKAAIEESIEKVFQ